MEKNHNNIQQPDKDIFSNPVNNKEETIGRTSKEDTHDISHVDQQEGTMDNGMLGGNFSKENPEDQDNSKTTDDLK